MRLLLYASPGCTTVLTKSASEPALAEAAYKAIVPRRWLMGDWSHAPGGEVGLSLWWIPPSAMLQPIPALVHHHLQRRYHVDLGSDGVILAAALLLDARDRATTFLLADGERRPGTGPNPNMYGRSSFRDDGASERRIVSVSQFLRALIGTSYLARVEESLPSVAQTDEHARTPLKSAFADGLIYMTHFVKAVRVDALDQAYLLKAITRGAGIVCGDANVDLDIAVPVLLGTTLVKENVTAILVRVTNGRISTARPWSAIVNVMDPDLYGMFERNIESAPRPAVVRVVLALASPKSVVKTRRGRAETGGGHGEGRGDFTAYDVWCAGASHETFAVVHPKEEQLLRDVLKELRAPYRPPVAFEEDGAIRAARQMQPAVAAHPDHFSNWAECPFEDDPTEPLAEDADEDEDDSDDSWAD